MGESRVSKSTDVEPERPVSAVEPESYLDDLPSAAIVDESRRARYCLLLGAGASARLELVPRLKQPALFLQEGEYGRGGVNPVAATRLGEAGTTRRAARTKRVIL